MVHDGTHQAVNLQKTPQKKKSVVWERKKVPEKKQKIKKNRKKTSNYHQNVNNLKNRLQLR